MWINRICRCVQGLFINYVTARGGGEGGRTSVTVCDVGGRGVKIV